MDDGVEEPPRSLLRVSSLRAGRSLGAAVGVLRRYLDVWALGRRFASESSRAGSVDAESALLLTLAPRGAASGAFEGFANGRVRLCDSRADGDDAGGRDGDGARRRAPRLDRQQDALDVPLTGAMIRERLLYRRESRRAPFFTGRLGWCGLGPSGLRVMDRGFRLGSWGGCLRPSGPALAGCGHEHERENDESPFHETG